jgi:L-alanine-DL-glutamate epimerase-like enolase superfamily enzyme
VQLSHRAVSLPLATPFTISRETSVDAPLVWVEVRKGDVSGFGEAAPDERYDQTVETAQAFLDEAGELIGDDPFAFEEICMRLEERPGEMAAKAAIECALHDLVGKLLGVPTWRQYGLRRVGPPTSWTIWLGDPDDMARRAEGVDPRFRRLKLKLGGRDGLDVERVRAVRGVTDLPLMVDVNEYWELEEAVENIEAISGLDVQYVEQPLPARDPGGPELKRRAKLPVYVDEDCHTVPDVPGCAERAHGINIKLAKSGGIREAIRMAVTARALGLGVMLGCMLESGLGISAGAQVASLCDHVDLDGNLLLAEDPWPGVEFTDGVQLPPDAPGLGVHAQEVSDPR